MFSLYLWLGDYFGPTTTSHNFIATFTRVRNQNVTSIFARRGGTVSGEVRVASPS